MDDGISAFQRFSIDLTLEDIPDLTAVGTPHQRQQYDSVIPGGARALIPQPDAPI